MNVNSPLIGYWEVTTEGDCEGRTTRNLGTYYGWLDEIAFKLASQSYYSLRFSKVDQKIYLDNSPSGNTVIISVGPEFGISISDKIEEIGKLIVAAGRSVYVSNASYGIQLSVNKPVDIEKKEIMDKLTDREIGILGLKR